MSKTAFILPRNQSVCQLVHHGMRGMLRYICWYLQELQPTSEIPWGKVVHVYGNLRVLGIKINLRKVLAVIAGIADRHCASK